jgi:adenylosuccinate lyase
MRNVAEGLIVNEAVVTARLEAELPFMATEDMLMEAVRNGADRQVAHEVIRTHAMAAVDQVKSGGTNDLLERLSGTQEFNGLDLEGLLDASRYVGRAPEQVDTFVEMIVEPLRHRYAKGTADAVELRI